MRTQLTHVVDYFDFDAFVSLVYGMDFEIVADQESSNDTTISFTAKRGVLGRYEQQSLADAHERGFWGTYQLHTIVADLCNRHLLPEGSYNVHVSW
jgi:hypothetical protein